MKNIKILVATHKKYKMPADTSVYLPIHVGCEGKKKLGFQGDNSGENISVLNPYYCELIGLYWAWKNLECDYLGLVHYRRYFTKMTKGYNESINIDDVILNRFEVEKLLENSEVIVPKRRKYYIETLYSHYDYTFDGTHLDEYMKYTPEQKRRLSFKPGITGLWQISGRSNSKNFDDVVKLDVTYLDGWTIWKDIEILLKTIRVVVMKDGVK